MAEIGFFVWKLSSMPTDPAELAAICTRFGIKRLAFKVLDGKWRYNATKGDQSLLDYFSVLRAAGIIVEGWGYHYPDDPTTQGLVIAERCKTLGLHTYHIDVEGEWNQALEFMVERLLERLPVAFEFFLCSYRFVSQHPGIPWDAFMKDAVIDGASPQVYWAAAHNPGAQLELCLKEYAAWQKPVHPVGATFGAYFKVGGQTVYWEPTVEDITEFRETAARHGLERIYWYSLDWVLQKERLDWLEAATGQDRGQTPPPPSPVSDVLEVVNCSWVNVRSQPNTATDNRVAVIRAGQQVHDYEDDSGPWKHVELGLIQGWIHGDYLEPA